MPASVRCFIEHSTEVLAATVQAKDFNCGTQILGACPCLKGVVHVESITLVCEEEGDCVAHCIVYKSDEEMVPLAHGHRGRSLDIGVYFVPELGGLLTDMHLWNRLAGHAHIYACITVLLV